MQLPGCQSFLWLQHEYPLQNALYEAIGDTAQVRPPPVDEDVFWVFTFQEVRLPQSGHLVEDDPEASHVGGGAGLITEERLGGHVYCRACNGALTPQCVPAEAEVGDDEALTICADKYIGRPEVAVDEALVGATVGTHSADAVEVGEGGGELPQNGEDQLGRDGGLPPLAVDKHLLEGPVVAIHDNVNEALVLDYLVVPEDPRMGEVEKGGQSCPDGIHTVLTQTVELDLLHGEVGASPERVDNTEGPC